MHGYFVNAVHVSLSYKLSIARHIVYITCIEVLNCQISPEINSFSAKYINTFRKRLASAAHPLKFLQHLV